jgi:hypothetical protein
MLETGQPAMVLLPKKDQPVLTGFQHSAAIKKPGLKFETGLFAICQLSVKAD